MNDSHEEQLQSVQLTIEQAKNNIERLKQLEKLYGNDDFRKIISEGYFRDEASRLVLLRADANMRGKEETRHVDRLIDGVGALRQYFSMIEQFGRMSERALKQHESTREELLREQLEATEYGAEA